MNQFFMLLEKHDVRGLDELLSPAFQVVRADGSSSNKSAHLSMRYLATVTGVVNGKPYTPGPAPRLSVFSWTGKRWQLAGHANFNPLSG